jgi:hypothetical protein
VGVLPGLPCTAPVLERSLSLEYSSLELPPRREALQSPRRMRMRRGRPWGRRKRQESNARPKRWSRRRSPGRPSCQNQRESGPIRRRSRTSTEEATHCTQGRRPAAVVPWWRGGNRGGWLRAAPSKGAGKYTGRIDRHGSCALVAQPGVNRCRLAPTGRAQGRAKPVWPTPGRLSKASSKATRFWLVSLVLTHDSLNHPQ